MRSITSTLGLALDHSKLDSPAALAQNTSLDPQVAEAGCFGRIANEPSCLVWGARLLKRRTQPAATTNA